MAANPRIYGQLVGVLGKHSRCGAAAQPEPQA